MDQTEPGQELDVESPTGEIRKSVRWPALREITCYDPA